MPVRGEGLDLAKLYQLSFRGYSKSEYGDVIFKFCTRLKSFGGGTWFWSEAKLASVKTVRQIKRCGEVTRCFVWGFFSRMLCDSSGQS